jgi:hypothetical protein
MENEKKTMSGVIWLVIAVITVILFYYFAIPPILNFISSATQFVTSTEFLFGVIVGAFAVIFVSALTRSRYRLFT